MSKVLILVSIALIASFACATTLSDNALLPLFAQWQTLYGKRYLTSDMADFRFNIFKNNYEAIVAWNSDPTAESEVGLNEFADLTDEEFAALYTGVIEHENTPVDSNVITAGSFPERVDHREQGNVHPVKNQGRCGSCWAFSALATVEAVHKMSGKEMTTFAEQQLVDCQRDGSYGCRGGWPYLALRHVARQGIMLEADYPYMARDQRCQFDSSKATMVISGYSSIQSRNVAALKTANADRPVSICLRADQPAFRFYKGGVVEEGCYGQINHAVELVGYGDYEGKDAFFVKNSWGADWGLKGYIHLATTKESQGGVCNVLSYSIVPTPL